MSDPTPTPTKTLTAQCHCKAIHYTLTVPLSLLPLPVHLCHCSICRYTHGAPCVFHAGLPADIKPSWIHPSGPQALTTYQHSADTARRIVFCSTCGCQVADITVGDEERWTVSTSIFSTDHNTADNFVIDKHIFIDGDSVPGWGFHHLLPRVAGREMKFYAGDRTGALLPANRPLAANPTSDSPATTTAQGDDRLHASCHCGGISISFPRPTPDVLADPIYKSRISPLTPRKWIATLDLCSDCRLVSGTHLVPWTFIPLHLLQPAMGPDFAIGTAKTYESSAGVRRAFCGTCGATAFYWCEERPKWVDVAIGLVRAPEGVMAEDWVTWRLGVGREYSGEEFDGEFSRAVVEGLEAWGEMAGGKGEGEGEGVVFRYEW
ncbi:hypothetical protein FQN50_002705 [Emmonsiellopsis sp. PD_5]|nr:hypothetical protein FQN50_002705 [Emmonsiellopsis sp. PD_5]